MKDNAINNNDWQFHLEINKNVLLNVIHVLYKVINTFKLSFQSLNVHHPWNLPQTTLKKKC